MVAAFTKIPDESAWYGYEADLDVKYMHGLFFGKSIEEVQRFFGQGHSIERMDELMFAPRPVFQYYVQAFSTFVLSEKAAGDSDSASAFIDLLLVREERDPGSVKAVLKTLSPCIDFVANNQVHFDADEDIYGNFRERLQPILELSNA
ncbi:hypothetical protein [Undibacterium baiyunense]|uniref:Uncharacterized protein n=1 Tax=Undibacterium baiyunense TaxID=2828731 RepID=A0A941I1Y3_9BURK|nr:hypothetical protein [Undibacterium baiyunense]MBR7746888.1 hypothetical protein [Undibacterium baiyunense]